MTFARTARREEEIYVRGQGGKTKGPVGWNFVVSLALVLTCALVVGLVLSAQAFAAQHPFLETFGSAAQPTFANAEGIAVDQATGDLLVIDAGAGTISRFKPDGMPANFSALGTNVIDGHGLWPRNVWGGQCEFPPNNNAGASFPPAMTASGRGLLPPHNHRALNFNHRQRSPRPAA